MAPDFGNNVVIPFGYVCGTFTAEMIYRPFLYSMLVSYVSICTVTLVSYVYEQFN